MKTMLALLGRLVTVIATAALASQAAASDLLVGNFNAPEITQLDGATGAWEGTLEPCGTSSLPASGALKIGPDGWLYAGSPGALRRFDLTSGSLKDVFVPGLPGKVLNFVFAPDGSLWGTLGSANKLFHADGTNGALLGPLVDAAYPTGMDIGPNGNLYVASWTSQKISRFDIGTGALLGTFDVPIAGAGVAAIGFGPDGKLYAAIGSGTDIVRFDPDGTYLGPFIPAADPHPSAPFFFAWGPDGRLYVGSNGSDEVLRYDATTGAFVDTFGVAASPSGLVFVPDRTANLPCLLSPVPTSSGDVLGFLRAGVRLYEGIPYAEAPTGSLRWKRPVPKSHSAAPIYAFAHGPRCPQQSGGNENCLKMSIWRPDSPPTTPLPVLFYIHGGGLAAGSMSWNATDGSNLALAQNVIVVEPQYRLGALGFFGLPGLAAEDPNGSTGNYGFLDQLEALRWVRDNIAAFGGDPNQVTIAGQSAGGWSVCALMASPLSDGLFRAGIVQSGNCDNARALADLPSASPVLGDPYFGATIYKRSRDVATSAGCDSNDLGCLRSKSAADLVLALGAQPKTTSGDPPVNPAIDGYFLSEQPLVLLRQGAADHRPLVIGTVANESTYFTQGPPPLENVITSAAIYDFALRSELGNTRTDALETVYPATNVPSVYPTLAEELRTLFDDAGAVCPTLDAADAIAQGGSPAWVYHLTFPPTYLPSSTHAALRTFHNLDLFYIFGTYPLLGSAYGIATDADDAALSVAMQNAWGSFVRTGAPSTTPSWPVYAPVTPGDLASVSVLQFDLLNNTVPGTTFRGGRCAALFPVANQLDPDRDVATSEEDNCPVTTNTSQADSELDTVGDACDSCVNVANPRVAADFLTTNPWATLTGGQRDDDHDGYGNLCDAKFASGPLVGPADLAQFRASNGHAVSSDTCGTAHDRPCAIFDLDQTGPLIAPGDLTRFRMLNGKLPGAKCPSCPLACTAGTAGSCP